MTRMTRRTATHTTSLLLASAFLGLFLLAHCVPHPGHDDDHGRPCQICHVWSLPFIAGSKVELAAPRVADIRVSCAGRTASLSLGFWLASPNRPPPSSLFDCC
jgi:hypothetical protein